MSRNKKIYRTNISPVNWCSIIDGQAEYRQASISFGENDAAKDLSWFDALLKGGLIIPKGGKPLSILLAGPPGSGKTTFALELCYELAKNKVGNDSALSSYFITTDQNSEALIDNAIDHGYEDIDHYLKPISFFNFGQEVEHLKKQQGMVFVWGKDEIEALWKKKNRNEVDKRMKISNLIEEALNIFSGVIAKSEKENLEVELLSDTISLKNVENKGKYVPHVLVIDSLNILSTEKKEDFFEEFMSAVSNDSEIVVFMLDSSDSDLSHDIWEYACDMIIRLDYRNNEDYYLRTLEIVKARYQSHVWGTHQLKIYEMPEKKTLPQSNNQSEEYEKLLDEYNNAMKRGHPFNKEGGIFIYPSIHYFLSRYKRHEYSDFSDTIPTKPILGDGFRGIPKGRCTAFIGTRGGHKSHFGYLTGLEWINSKSNNALLVISLRDDEYTTFSTLEKIRKSEFPKKDNIKNHQKLDQIDVLYFHPGYITPEEFFHRVFIAVQRLKKNTKDVMVLFNSLDQLRSRFPLCAKQEIFIPGIIEFFSGEGITSIFITVDEPGQPLAQFGLLPMADLILSFYPKSIAAEDYLNHIASQGNWLIDKPLDSAHSDRIKDFRLKMPGNRINIISLQVVRFAGGERAGAEGILELVDKYENLGVYPITGLHYTKFDSAYDTGKLTHEKRI